MSILKWCDAERRFNHAKRGGLTGSRAVATLSLISTQGFHYFPLRETTVSRPLPVRTSPAS